MPDIKLFTKQYWLPLLIIILTIAARFYHLNYQSLWFDELYSMTIAAPDQTHSDIFTDIKTDFHPPLYYLFLNYTFQFISFNDLSGRLLSAITGCLSIWLVYLFGKQLKVKSAGLLLALFFSVFFYHIKYSQEIRMYIFLFALVIISSLLFLKYLRENKIQYLLLYVLVSTVTIYTQYYGFFIILAHGLCLIHLLLIKQIDFCLFRNFIKAFCMIILFYLPWIPMIILTGNRQHFIDLPPIWYFFEYLYEYTGKEPVTTIFILTGLVLYIVKAVKHLRQCGLKQSPFQLLVLYSAISIFIITYIISVFKPVLSKHGTLAGLPFVLAMVFTGYSGLKDKWFNLILTVIVLTNIINLLFISRYYTKNFKDNFRQITEIVINDNKHDKNIVFVSQLSKFYNYYFDQKESSFRALNPNNIQPTMLSTNPKKIIIINAPFTEEKLPKLEPVNELGFQILNPRLINKTDSIKVYCDVWNTFISENYIVDTVYNDPKKNIPVAYRFKLINQQLQ